MTKEGIEEPQAHHHNKDYVDPPPVPLIDTDELKLWSLYRALIAVFIATLLFLYITVATVIGHKHQTGPCDDIGLLGIEWAFGGLLSIAKANSRSSKCRYRMSWAGQGLPEPLLHSRGRRHQLCSNYQRT